jgi:hypothetical protein
MQVLRHSRRDALLVLLAFAHGAVLLTAPSAPVVAIALWWNANTVAHNFIHLPFFRARALNRVFSAYLSLLLGLPQTLWRDRHLAHHADRRWRLRWSRRLVFEAVLVLALWIVIALTGPEFFFGTWLPGWLGGLLLCSLQGRYEHVRGTVSHYGAFYNTAFFNDGYHIEHHERPATHWTQLPRASKRAGERSRWPAVLRWLESVNLEGLERMVLRSPALQRFVVRRHARALRKVIARVPDVQRVTIVGGALFPRTALALLDVAPHAHITVIDQSAENIAAAHAFLNGRIRWVQACFRSTEQSDADLLIIPLSYSGDRASLYRAPPARAVAIHDWLWHRGGRGFLVSVLLLKRINLVLR